MPEQSLATSEHSRMPLTQDCPEPQLLRSFQLGLLEEPESVRLEHHLEHCSSCVLRLDEPSGDDPLLEALYDPEAVPAFEPEPPVVEFVERLKSLYWSRIVRGPLTAGESHPQEEPPVPTHLGRYQVLSPSGAGGMGRVYKAYDPQLQRLVAIKVPRFGGSPQQQAQARQRFLHEAQAAARIRHPHVCSVYDAGQQDDHPYVVMDLVEGPSLAGRLEQGRFEDCRQAVALVLQVAEGLAAVHAAGIVHRDLKPSNILLDSSGKALLTDFGLALLAAAPDHLTRNGAVLGTPAYMAPEQGDPKAGAIGASDVYSLGAVLYQMLTGQLPFGGGLGALPNRRGEDTPPAPSSLRPDLDAGLDAIVRKAMAPRPEDRYPSAAAFHVALSSWLAGPRRSRRTWRVGLAIAIPVGVCLALALYLAPRRSPESVERLPSPAPPTALAAPAFEGWIDARVWDPRQPGRRDRGLRDVGTLPLKAGDRVRIETRLNRPAFQYIVQIETTGHVVPLYPWKPNTWERPAEERAHMTVNLPENSTRDGQVGGWEVGDKDPPGMETLVLLVRESPLPRDFDLAKLLGNLHLPPQRMQNQLAAVWFEDGAVVLRPTTRSFKSFDPQRINDPVLQTQHQLWKHLHKHFACLRAVSYANVGKGGDRLGRGHTHAPFPRFPSHRLSFGVIPMSPRIGAAAAPGLPGAPAWRPSGFMTSNSFSKFKRHARHHK